MTAKADGAELSQRLSKIETAISRRKTIEFTYYTMQRDDGGEAQGRPLPPRLPRRAVLSDRPLARARGGPRLPALANPRQGLLRDQGRARLRRRPRTSTAATTPAAPSGRWARSEGTAKIFLRERIAWLVERDFGGYGEIRNPGAQGDGAPGKGAIFETEYASSRQMVAWVLRWRAERDACSSRPSSRRRSPSASTLLRERHRGRLRARRLRSRAVPPAARGRPRPTAASESVDPARALRPTGHARRAC